MSDQTLSEVHRLGALQDLGVLDTPAESAYDEIVEIAASICDTRISLVTLIDVDRQWFKANLGLDEVHETPREVAFCAHTIQNDGIFEVSDASSDPRFASNPLVTGYPNIRFYAGTTLRLSNGARVGSLCVIDQSPGKLSTEQRRILGLLSSTVVRMLEARSVTTHYAESEARFRALSVSAPLGIFSATAAGECTYTNERWQGIFGMSYDDALGHGWSKTLHPQDKSAVFSQWQRKAFNGEEFDMSFRVLKPDGSVVSVRSISRPVLSENGDITGHVGSVEDVTEHKAQQEALARSEFLLAETGAMADVGGWELELASNTLRWTDQTFRIHDLSPGANPSLDEAAGFYTTTAQPIIREALSRAINEGRGWDVELPMTTAKNRSIWVRSVGRVEFDQGKPIRLLGACQDVTARVLQHKALELAHEKISIATESGDIGVWDWTVQTNELTWTAQMFSLYGLPTGSSLINFAFWAERLHPDDQVATKQYFKNALDSTATTIDTEYRIVWPDGSVHYIRAAARITRDSRGNAIQVLGVSWDVTPLRKLSNELAQQHELLEVTLQSIGDAVVTSDTDGCVTWLNPVAEQMTGWPSHEAMGKPVATVFKIIDETTRKPAQNPVSQCLNLEQPITIAPDKVLISRTGEEFGIEDSAAPIRSKTGELLGAVLVFHDVSTQRQLCHEMHHRSIHDTLTGLVNRSEFERCLQDALTMSTDESVKFTLMYIDLDQFKLVNDSCGHAKGDQLLVQIARLMSEIVRYDDTVARIGGDEFALILRDYDADQAKTVAQRICDTMSDFRFMHNGKRFRIGTSIGLVPLDQRWGNVEAAMQAADVSCFAAKNEGRNRVHVWYETDIALQERRENTEWATRIEQALDEKLFELHAQRIQALGSDGDGMHAEILIRMRDEDGKLVYPDAFICSAERFQLATRIDRWVLKSTIDLLLKRSNLNDINTLFINRSGQSVGDRVFHTDTIQLLSDAGADVCKRLCLEITETAAITNMADASKFVHQVRKLGVKVALDDFGAGASSFGYLKTLKVDLLKIDGQFIEGIVNDPLDSAAVRCFVDVAKVMGVDTIAEYVSDPDILACIRNIGIDYAQGFYLHQPEPVERLLDIDLLKSQDNAHDSTLNLQVAQAAFH